MTVTPLANEYISLDELKSTAGISLDYADDDLQRAINAASEGVEQICNRRFWVGDEETRFYTPVSPGLVIIDDLVTLSDDGLMTDQNFDGTFEQPWVEDTDFFLSPLNSPARGWPFTRLELVAGWRINLVFPSWSSRSVQLTGTFGWPAPPAGVIDATTIIATKLAKRKREAPFGIVNAMMDSGGAVRIGRTDPDVNGLLAPYMREFAT